MAKSDNLALLSFASRDGWEAWLTANGGISSGLWLKFAKKGSGVATVSKAEAIEAALCHGWIDGQLQPFDAHYFLTRFTPRKARSLWSEVNRTTAIRLMTEGRMAAAGLAEVDRAKADGRWDAAYAPQGRAEVPADLQTALDANPAALTLFNELGATNRYALIVRTHNTRRPEARAACIAKFVAMLACGETIYPHRAKP